MAIELKYLGHSAFIVTVNGVHIAIDPFITGNTHCNTPVSEFHVDEVLLTHGHADHYGDTEALAENNKNMRVTAIFELANYCTSRGLTAQGVNIGGDVKFPWGTAVWVPSVHSNSNPEGGYAGDPAGVILKLDGCTIYHSGDSGLNYDMKMIGEVYKPDIALLPIGGYYTMGIDESIYAINWTECKKVIPMHWKTFPVIDVSLEEFKAKVLEKTKAEPIILQPNHSITLVESCAVS